MRIFSIPLSSILTPRSQKPAFMMAHQHQIVIGVAVRRSRIDAVKNEFPQRIFYALQCTITHWIGTFYMFFAYGSSERLSMTNSALQNAHSQSLSYSHYKTIIAHVCTHHGKGPTLLCTIPSRCVILAPSTGPKLQKIDDNGKIELNQETSTGPQVKQDFVKQQAHIAGRVFLHSIHPYVASHPPWRAKPRVLCLLSNSNFANTSVYAWFCVSPMVQLPLEPSNVSSLKITLALLRCCLVYREPADCVSTRRSPHISTNELSPLLIIIDDSIRALKPHYYVDKPPCRVIHATSPHRLVPSNK